MDKNYLDKLENSVENDLTKLGEAIDTLEKNLKEMSYEVKKDKDLIIKAKNLLQDFKLYKLTEKILALEYNVSRHYRAVDGFKYDDHFKNIFNCINECLNDNRNYNKYYNQLDKNTRLSKKNNPLTKNMTDRHDVEVFAKNVYFYRISMNWTQKRLADEAGLSKDVIWRIEHGKYIKVNKVHKRAIEKVTHMSYKFLTQPYAIERPIEIGTEDDEKKYYETDETRKIENFQGKYMKFIYKLIRIEDTHPDEFKKIKEYVENYCKEKNIPASDL